MWTISSKTYNEIKACLANKLTYYFNSICQSLSAGNILHKNYALFDLFDIAPDHQKKTSLSARFDPQSIKSNI